jgi:tripartite-type tricarboxylate transporter receptor subunit TctC
MNRRALALVAAPAVALATMTATTRHAGADEIADFFRGKTISMLIGYPAGGGYDLYARTIARHMGRHIPGNPQFVSQNMPGASSMVLGNHIARVAPRDGTVMAAVNSALLFDWIFMGAASKAQFKGPDLTAIGNVVSSANTLVVLSKTGITSLEQLKTRELMVGATGRSGDTYLQPLAAKRILGLDGLKLVPGYPGTNEVAVALERGEVTGRVWDLEGIKAARPHWLTDGTIRILAQFAPRKMPGVPEDVPLVKDFVESEEAKRALDVIFLSTLLSRPYVGPPGIPPARVKALRAAFMATLTDPAFRAETQKVGLNVEPTSGEEIDKLVADAYALPPALIERVREVLKD